LTGYLFLRWYGQIPELRGSASIRLMNFSLVSELGANAILLLHVLFVAFVVLGLVAILLGKGLSWSWVRNPWFRWGHLAAIGVVVLQSWFGVICPLTTFEMALRGQGGGEGVYSGSFIRHWLEAILYYRAPPWVFVMVYTLFGALVVGSWYWVRPRGFSGRLEN
jgi:hypothetical protein